jgi:hypothetical protein
MNILRRSLPIAVTIAVLCVPLVGSVEDNSGASGRPQFDGIKYPPKSSGAFDVDAFYRAVLQASGQRVTDAATLCEIRKETPILAREKLSGLLAPGDAALAGKMAPNDIVQARYMLGLIESYDGKMAAAIAQWEQALGLAQARVPETVPMLLDVLGAAYLHKAEMDNGVYKHPNDRCLFPPRAGAARAKLAITTDVDKAIGYLTRYLEGKPDDLEARWLLNVAYFTKGQYPEGVPPKLLVPPSAFGSKQDIGRFVDVAGPAGLTAAPYRAGGIAVDDFDNDGLMDIATAGYDICDKLHIFKNNGDGTFTDRSLAAGVANVAGGLDILQTDYNNDGCIDLLVPRGAWLTPMPLALLKNDCKGNFTDVTKQAGLGGIMVASQTVAWADIDNDGLLDLFIGDEQGPCQLWRNKGDGTFENISKAAGIDKASFTKGVVSDDYDNDGYADFYVSNMRGDNWLFHNNKNGTFTDVARQAGVQQSFAGFATWFFDYDNDGWPDIFAGSDYASVDEQMRTYLKLPHRAGNMRLYKNLRNGTFQDVTASVGLANKVYMPMGSNFGDLDNDGFLDIYLATGAPDLSGLAPKVVLRNDGGTAFVDVGTNAGLADIHKGHGSSFVDFENRGSLDLLASMGGAVPSDMHALRLFRNPGNDNDWISLKLVGTKTNRAAVGVHIKLTVQNQGGAVRTIARTVSSGSSFGSSPFEQHIGLGKGAVIQEIEVNWPVSRTKQTFKNVAVRQFLEIKEGEATYTKLGRKRFRLGAPRPAPARAAAN